MPVELVRQGMDGTKEMEMASVLVEDKTTDNMSYVDYLCAIHREILNEVRQ